MVVTPPELIVRVTFLFPALPEVTAMSAGSRNIIEGESAAVASCECVGE